MPADDAETGQPSPELQFDRVETSGSPSQTAGPLVTCAVCGKSVGDEYYTANGKPICASCRVAVLSAATTPKTAGPLIGAVVFGIGGMLAGTAVYFAVDKAMGGGMIGIVAIAVGYIVGYMVRKGAGGRGGRPFQVVAVVLTYCSIDLAYALVVLKDFAVPRSYLPVLPLLFIVQSMPWGLILGLIILIALRQAWVMTAPHQIEMSGPYKVGAGPEAASN